MRTTGNRNEEMGPHATMARCPYCGGEIVIWFWKFWERIGCQECQWFREEYGEHKTATEVIADVESEFP